MDDVVSILVVVVAVALAAYRNYIKKEKKRNNTSRRKTTGRAPVCVDAKDPMSFVNKDNMSQRVVKEEDKRRGDTVEKNRKVSGRLHEKEVRHTTSPAASGKNIQLKTPEEARRAFIYSEIFNRKY